ncbi:hypothetical protein [Coleofasciculus sp. FACHB-1120]|uniref:hypothetical protein n=1 Tax=Coleofasciculus sp. FACHB-1120 TaxID=2692783 RepID=UPI001686116A|nr:hypothetical protein [Coleofasciculus sp. FACHB-1120]MBD2740122.1 hypothetical protein [Coleofasciculus sp. FACHB-1120]
MFKSEALLEEFIWLHLSSLLNLTHLKKQHIINKQNRADILGMNSLGRLAILEIKKGGDKGSIDQLIRYKDNLINNRPQTPEFSKVDFNKDFILIAVASSFSDSTITYAESKIPGCLLLTYQVKKTLAGEYYLILKNIDNTVLSQVKVEVFEDSLFDSLPSFMQAYLLEKPQVRENVLKMIQTIQSYSSDIRFDSYASYSQDNVSKKIVFAKYNKQGQVPKDKTCAFFSYDYGLNFPTGKLSLEVYLPTVDINPRTYKRTKKVDGIYVETNDFVKVTELRDLNYTFYKNLGLPLRYPFKTPEIDNTFYSFEDYYINYRKYMKSRQKLSPVNHSDFTSVEGVVKMALEDWSVR